MAILGRSYKFGEVNNLVSQQITFFSHNGVIEPIEKATIPFSNLEYSYGFGVYETIRVANGIIYFLREHVQRLISSAKILQLDHPFSALSVEQSVYELVDKAGAGTYNLKLLLIGAPTKDRATLSILCLNPYFPDRKLYKEGAALITYAHERPFPHAKSLNMLQSYLAYRKAKQSHAYDALLINRVGCITEGTRTNFFCLQGKTIITPKDHDILLGVMRSVVLSVAVRHGFVVVQKDIPLKSVSNYPGSFVTSTSSKVLPVKSIEGHVFVPPSQEMRELMQLCDQFLAECRGKLE